MKHISTVPICSKPLFIYKLDIKEDLTLKFNEEKFRPMEQEGTTALLGENLNILKKYKGLKKEINKAVDATLKKILMLKNINYKIFSSWLTKTRPGDCWNSHTHYNSWLTGVYYPKSNPAFSIKFYDDNTSIFGTPPTEHNLYNSSEWTIVPEDNNLILFFSQVRHKIRLNTSNQNRFSLAFNILPKGEFGTIDSKSIF